MATAIGRRPPTRQYEPPKMAEVAGQHVVKSMAGFLRAVRDSRSLQSSRRDYGLQVLEKIYETGLVTKSAMGEDSGTAGGYIVPQEFSYQLMQTMAQESVIYPRANVIPMFAAETLCPRIDVETVQATGTSPLFGGVLFKWALNSQLPETEPTFRQLSLRAWNLLGDAIVSNQWLEDAGPAGDTYLCNLLSKAAAWYCEYAFLNGTGSGQSMPLGIIKAVGTGAAGSNTGPTALVARSVGNQINSTDIGTLSAAMYPGGWRTAVWMCSPTALAQIPKITNFQLNEAGEQGGGDGHVGLLMNRPIFVSDILPALGTTGDLVFIDPSKYVIGMRQEVIIDVSGTPGFRNYQTDFRVWLRLDGKPQTSAQITLQDGTTKVSPFAVLSA